MIVKTDFEVKHFIEFINKNANHVTMEIVDTDNTWSNTKVNGTDFKILNDVLPIITISCQSMEINNVIRH